MVMELAAVVPGAATTSMRPSLGPVTGGGWVVGVTGVVVVVVVVGVAAVVLDRRDRGRGASWWSWSLVLVVVVTCSFLARAATAAALAAPAAELAATEDWVAASWLCSALVWACLGGQRLLVGIHGRGVHGRLEHEEPQQRQRPTAIKAAAYTHLGRTAFWVRAPSRTRGFSFSGATWTL